MPLRQLLYEYKVTPEHAATLPQSQKEYLGTSQKRHRQSHKQAVITALKQQRAQNFRERNAEAANKSPVATIGEIKKAAAFVISPIKSSVPLSVKANLGQPSSDDEEMLIEEPKITPPPKTRHTPQSTEKIQQDIRASPLKTFAQLLPDARPEQQILLDKASEKA